MNRQQIINEIGQLKPSRNPDKTLNYSSIFIIPVPHRVHKIKQKDVKLFFKRMQINWELKNNTIEEDLYIYDIKDYVKNSIFEDIVFKDDIKKKKNFIYDKKNFFLSYKQKQINLEFDKLKFILTDIDLWIMDGNVAFFTYKIELDPVHIYDVNTISTKLNRELRDFKNITINIEEKKLYYRQKNLGEPLLKYFFSLTQGEDLKQSFLNFNYEDINLSNDFNSISTSTYYAKTITALHVKEDYVNIDGKKYEISSIKDSLSEKVTIDLGILEELSYLLGTTSAFDFEEELGYISYENYTYSIIKEQGINIWKYWSGVALEDSIAFFSISNGGSNIVKLSQTSNYYIYILNLYANIRLKYIESDLLDKDFVNIERVLVLEREIQILKNYYIATQIAVKFQPNYINNKISVGLKTTNLLNEVENNLEVTRELTKNNTDIVFSIGAGIATLSSIWLSNEVIVNLYYKYPIGTYVAIIFFIPLIIFLASKRSLIIKIIKKLFKTAYRFLM
jgi:hypothetical protein